MSTPAGRLPMKAEYINPFIESAEDVFDKMLNVAIKREGARVGTGAVERLGETLTSVIGISGAAIGVVALSFPRDTALVLAGRFMGTEVDDVTPEVTDALSEVANMVGGSAKAKFELDPPPELSLPTVVQGTDYKVRFPTKSVWVEVPFSSPAGDFVMEVSFTTRNGQGG
jgi:chemotaxis protein CheX